MIDYEQGLIVACIRDEEAFHNARSLRLSPSAFANEECAAVWDCLCKNADEGAPHNKVELWMRVQKDYPDAVEQVESSLSLASAEIDDISPHEQWATAVAEQWVERIKKDAWAEATQRVHVGESVVDVTRDILEKIAQAEDVVSIEEDKIERQRQAVKDRLHQRIMEGTGLVSTGILALDRELGHLEDYELIILAARPGNGKSALARQIAMEYVRMHKQPVSLVSMEMGVDQVVKFMAGTNCGISAKGIESDFEPRKKRFWEECQRFAGALGKFFYVHDDISYFDDMEAVLQSSIRRHRPGLIIVDYLQLLSPRRTAGMNREQQIAHMSRRLKNITQIHRIPVLVLSQMSRNYEQEGRMPRKSDLRESGALEQDADRIWFLHQDDKQEMIGKVQPMKLIQAKGRSTGEAMMDVGFEKHITKFLFNGEWRKSVDNSNLQY